MHLHQSPIAPSEKREGVPESLEKIVLACLEKKQADRPKSAADLCARIAAAGLKPWTREDVEAWWKNATPRPEPESKTKRRARPSTHLSGATVTVALDDRAAS